jgi:hypothetical protein
MERLLTALVVAVLTAWSVIVYDALTFDERLPVEEWRTVEVLNSPVFAGSVLQVDVHRTKVRDDCPVVSVRQAISDDGVPYDLPTQVSVGGPSDAEHVQFDYDIPSHLPSGSYTLRVYLTYTCPDFVWPTQQPDARFRVINQRDTGQ